MRAEPKGWIQRNTGFYGVLLIAYSALAVGLTYPAVKGLFVPHTMPGYGDVVQFQYFFWWFKRAIFDLGINPQVATLIYHPLGGVWIFGTLFNEISSAFLQLVLSVSQTYTLLWLFTFPATAITTFALAHYITKSRSASFLAGIIFAFSTYRYAHGLGHVGLFTTQWLPLYVYALLRTRDMPNFRSRVLLVIATLLAGLSEFPYYLVYFIGLFLVCFFLYGAWTRDRKIWNIRLLASVAIAFGALGLALAIGYSNILFAENTDSLSRSGTFWLSADLLGFVLPSQWHPLWGELFSRPGGLGRFGLDLVEHSHYIGYVSMGLFVVGIWKAHLRDKNLWALVIVVAFILALGPALKIGGQVVLDAPKDGQTTLVPLPYWAIMNLPFLDRLRGPSRHVVLMQLAIAIAAAAGWASIEKKLERFKTQRIGIAGLLTVVILFESLFMFPYAMTTVPISNVYRQLAEENLDGGILELPMALDRQAPEGRWFLNVFLRMYEGTIHRHPIVGGLAGRPDPEVIIFNETTPYIRELLGADRVLHHNIEDPFHQDWGVLARVGPSILQSYNIDYVILHKDTLFDDELRFLSDTLSQQLGEPFFDDGTVVAYRVMAADSIDWPRVDQMTVVASKGWYLPLWNGARVVRRMVENGQVVILSPERQIARLKLELNSRPGANNLVQISVNGHLLEASSLPKEGKNLVTRPFELKKGHNVVSFEVLGDSQYVGNQADIMQFDAEVSKLEVVAVDAVVFSSNAFTARFGQNIELLGVEWDAEYDEIMARNVNVTLYWRGGAPIKESYKVFVHLLDRAGNLIAQHDSVPVDWSRPTNAWQPGEIIVDRHQVTLPAAGSIDRIGVGMYDPESLRRLEAVVHKGAVHLVDNSVQLGWVP